MSTFASKKEINFGLIRSVYAIALVLGLEESFDSIFGYFMVMDRTLENAIYAVFMTYLILLLAITGIRMLAATTNLNIFVESSNASETQQAMRALMTFHLPILLLHALVYYSLCQIAKLMTGLSQIDEYGAGFCFAYAVLLLLNSCWIYYLCRGTNGKAQQVWMNNNLQFGAFLAVLGGCWLVAEPDYPDPWFDYSLFGAMLVTITINCLRDLRNTADVYAQADE